MQRSIIIGLIKLLKPNLKGNYIFIIILLAYLLGACKKDFQSYDSINSEEDKTKNLLSDHFQNLLKETPDTVSLEAYGTSIKSIFNQKKLSQLIYLRDSAWDFGQGHSKFYESDEMIVTPPSLSYVYPGSILKSSSIATDNFATLFGYPRAPIRVNLSFPSSLSAGTIASPSLSESRIFLRNALMAPDFSGSQIDDFYQTISYFSKYEEVKLAYGYNVNEKRLFSTTNSNFDYGSSGTQYSTKLMARYTVKNFTYSMYEPTEDELINLDSIPANVFDGVSPVYINSVTYGRFGLLVVETNNSASEMTSVFEKLVKKIFKKTTESFTTSELSLFSSCRVTIYLLGSNMGESVTQLLINPNPETFSNFVSENVGVFTASDPGVPISFTAKYLKDNSPFKTVFKIDFPN